jgi:myosin X
VRHHKDLAIFYTRKTKFYWSGLSISQASDSNIFVVVFSFFVLTESGIDYYRSPDTSIPPTGQISLNSLCTVISPDEAAARESGHWTFTLNTRRRFYRLTAKSNSDSVRWVQAIQEVIDNKPPIVTPTEKLVDDLREAGANQIEAIYRVNPILSYTSANLKASLLPLPYGEVQIQKAKSRGYGTLQEEALRIFNSLQDKESLGNPIPVIQGILQTCFDLPALRDEVYCQLIKQTANPPEKDSIAVLRNWQVCKYVKLNLRTICSSEDWWGWGCQL